MGKEKLMAAGAVAVLAAMMGVIVAMAEIGGGPSTATSEPTSLAEGSPLTPPPEEVSRATIPPWVPTPPAWDGTGTPPPGWKKIDTGNGSYALVPIPSPCAPLYIKGERVCGPPDAIYRFTGPGLCTQAEPCEQSTITTVELGNSIVMWESRGSKGAAEEITVLQWQVAPEHEEAFKDLRQALFGP